MFYSQLNNNPATPIETVRCGLSCFSIHFHIPKRNIKSSAGYLTPSSSKSSLSSFLGRGNGERKSIAGRIKGCIEYLWVTRVSIQFNSIPCLILLLILLFLSIFLYIENSNGHYYFHQVSSISFLSSSTDSLQPSLYDLHHKLDENYPNAHVIAGPPLSREDLGHISWLFLHTQGVTYSEEPTEQRKQDLLNFWEAFSRLYPCGECAKHMRNRIAVNPPNVENNRVYSQWLCEFHNEVTYRLHGGGDEELEMEDCQNIEGILDRWSPNEFCGCDNEFIEGVDDEGEMNMDMDTVNNLGNNAFIMKQNTDLDINTRNEKGVDNMKINKQNNDHSHNPKWKTKGASPRLINHDRQGIE